MLVNCLTNKLKLALTNYIITKPRHFTQQLVIFFNQPVLIRTNFTSVFMLVNFLTNKLKLALTNYIITKPQHFTQQLVIFVNQPILIRKNFTSDFRVKVLRKENTSHQEENCRGSLKGYRGKLALSP